MDELINEFLTETNEGLAKLDIALVQLERLPGDKATLSFIFRLVHTIKGTCGCLNLPRLERVAHAAESVLGRIRDGALSATPETITILRPRENPKIGLRVDPDISGVPGMRSFRVLTWTEYIILAGLDRIRLIIADIAEAGTEKPGDDMKVIAALASEIPSPPASVFFTPRQD